VRTVGIAATVVAAAVAAAAVVMGVVSIPDIKRYLKMRAM
jgi:hypothetical protein